MGISVALRIFAALALLIIAPCSMAPASPEPISGAITITAAGDIMLAGISANNLRKQGYDNAFAAVRNELARGDLAVANLEFPLATEGKEFSGKKFRFRGSPDIADSLSLAGIRAVTLANNHILDFGAEALLETLQHLDRKGIARFGAGATAGEARRPAIITLKGKKVALLGYSLTLPSEFWAAGSRPGTALLQAEAARRDIAEARRVADHVMVFVHWGQEGTGKLRDYQPKFGRILIDAGADAVIGHHPHVLQGIERYKNGIICYSLGNFAFATSSRSSGGAMVHLTFGENGNRQLEIVPLDLATGRRLVQPRPAEGPAAQAILKPLANLSRQLGTKLEISDNRAWLRF